MSYEKACPTLACIIPVRPTLEFLGRRIVDLL